MRREPIHRRLLVPAFLAVTACGGGEKTSASAGTDSEGQTEATAGTAGTTTGTGTEATGSTGATDTTTAPTTGVTTGSATDADTTTGGELPDCSVYKDANACAAVVGCAWEPEGMICIVDCTLIHDQATCEAQDYCGWFNETCNPPI